LKIERNQIIALNNLGTALPGINRLDETLASYDCAIALNPDYAAAYWNKSLLKILMGEYL
jgi:tetratricopeptide (TPR) repeat protein